MGVKKGDIVTIYLPRIPEQVIAMLACAKIGAPHSVVYGGFSVEALAERIRRREPGADHRRWRLAARQDRPPERYRRRGHRPPATIEDCIVVKRTGQEIYMDPGAITGTTT